MNGEQIPVILNPAARGDRAKRALHAIADLSPRVDIQPTAGPGDAIRLAREAALAGSQIVVGVGGDGTVNEVARGLLQAGVQGAPCTLGILPLGTMNVLARELGIPLDLQRAWSVVEHGAPRLIDVWEAGNHPFLQLAGIGIDAEVVRQTSSRDKLRLGPFAYAKAAMRVLQEEAPHFQLETLEGQQLEGKALLLGNGRYYGGPVEFFPAASNADALIDGLLVSEKTASAAVSLGRAIVTGDFSSATGCLYFQTRGLRIQSLGKEVPLEVDGELAGETPLTVRLSEDWSLAVLAPGRPGAGTVD